MSNSNIMDIVSIIRSFQTKAPVNVIGIAKKLGIRVYTATDEDDDTLSGKIVKDKEMGGESGYAIFVNFHHSPARRRFTIAHEIAHFILHKELIGDGIVDDALYRSGLSSKEETMANKMAADILMPWHLLFKEKNDQVKTIPDLAKIFQVSESAMSIRLNIPC